MFCSWAEDERGLIAWDGMGHLGMRLGAGPLGWPDQPVIAGSAERLGRSALQPRIQLYPLSLSTAKYQNFPYKKAVQTWLR